LEDAENTLSFQSREIFYELYQQLIWLDERIGVFDQKIVKNGDRFIFEYPCGHEPDLTPHIGHTLTNRRLSLSDWTDTGPPKTSPVLDSCRFTNRVCRPNNRFINGKPL
jgi:hypothetical protein